MAGVVPKRAVDAEHAEALELGGIVDRPHVERHAVRVPGAHAVFAAQRVLRMERGRTGRVPTTLAQRQRLIVVKQVGDAMSGSARWICTSANGSNDDTEHLIGAAEARITCAVSVTSAPIRPGRSP